MGNAKQTISNLIDKSQGVVHLVLDVAKGEIRQDGDKTGRRLQSLQDW